MTHHEDEDSILTHSKTNEVMLLQTAQEVDETIKQFQQIERILGDHVISNIGKYGSDENSEDPPEVAEARAQEKEITKRVLGTINSNEENEGRTRILELAALGGGIEKELTKIEQVRAKRADLIAKVKNVFGDESSYFDDETLMKNILPDLNIPGANEATDFFDLLTISLDMAESLIVTKIRNGLLYTSLT